jgi:septum formation protein
VTPLADVDLVLGSGSPYRKALLERLTTRFRCASPAIDERAHDGEAPVSLAARLARDKACAIAAAHAGSVVIGSDQVADLDGRRLGKPGDAAAAFVQLSQCSGKEVVFHTAICVVDARVATAATVAAIDCTRVRFRTLGDDEIRRYLEREQPFDCAGSFKAEALGIALFEDIESRDPTALVGLPLIALCRLLHTLGIAAI